MLDKHLIPCSDTGESKVFYYKMKGDYHRYLAEFATANDRKEAAENSLVAYKAASDIALTELATTHPIRCVVFPPLQGSVEKADRNRTLTTTQRFVSALPRWPDLLISITVF